MLPNVGFGELMLLLVIGLLVVGPQRLPEITRAAAKAWRTFQQETGKAKSALKEALDEPTRELREAFAEPQAELKRTIEETRSIKGVIDQPDAAPTPSTDPHARATPADPHMAGTAPAQPAPASPPEPAYEPLPVVRDYEDT